MHLLTRKKIAIVVDDGFGQVELVEPRKAIGRCDYRDSLGLPPEVRQTVKRQCTVD